MQAQSFAPVRVIPDGWKLLGFDSGTSGLYPVDEFDILIEEFIALLWMMAKVPYLLSIRFSISLRLRVRYCLLGWKGVLYFYMRVIMFLIRLCQDCFTIGAW